MTKDKILEKYYELAKKLNKMPNSTDLLSFTDITRHTVRHHFGNMTNLQSDLIEAYPEIEKMIAPSVLVSKDLEVFRQNLTVKRQKSGNDSLVRNVNTLDYIAKFAEGVFKGRLKPTGFKKSKKVIKRNVNIVLSDHHYGSNIQKEETGFQDYGRVEESRRLAAVVKEVIEYKPQFRDESELTIHLLGDMIENKLHDPQDAAPLAEQVCRAIHMLSQAIARLSEAYPKVTIKCATGNHGRTLSRHEKRATSSKWDSIETMIYYAVKNGLSEFKNITFEIPKTPYVVTEKLGAKIFSTHGDTVLTPGNPGKSINTGGLEQQVNRINASLQDNQEYNVFIVGHVHVASVTQLNNGVIVITNGALCPANGFASSIGILESYGVQVLFESVPGFPVGDIRYIRVGAKEDADESLDKIIKPWENM